MAIEAIYQNGVIKPLRNVELRENERIKIEIIRFPQQETQKTEGKKNISLRGVWQGAFDISDEDIDEVTRMWDEGLEKQAKILGEVGND